ncbi:MAG: MATE family efflux transporter [Alphaproteobacteria bacterium]
MSSSQKTDEKPEQHHAHAVFIEGSLMRHVITMSFTASIGLMAIFAVDLVDMIFISMLGNVALAAAIGYAGTVLFFTSSINIGLSIAAGALVSQAIGRDEEAEARHFATSVATYAVIIGLIVPTLVFLNLEHMLKFLGASGEALTLATSYLTILLPSMFLLGIAMTAMAVLRAHGDAKRSMYATLIGGIVNAVFDPIFIFALDLGLEGAAMASVLARVVMLAVALMAALKHHNGFSKPHLGRTLKDTRTVMNLAAPAVLANVATPVGSAFIVREMAKYGADAVAGMAIIGRVTPVAFSVLFALSGAIGPILGQNFGAGLGERVRDGFIAGLKFIVVYVLIVSLLLFLCRNLIIDLFDVTGVAQSLVLLFCGPLALMFIFNGFIFVGNAAFNNLGHPAYSAYINWGKNTLGTWPFVLAGGALMGAQGVLIGQAVGTFAFGIMAYVLARKIIGKPKHKDQATSRFHGFEIHRRLHAIYSSRHH